MGALIEQDHAPPRITHPLAPWDSHGSDAGQMRRTTLKIYISLLEKNLTNMPDDIRTFSFKNRTALLLNNLAVLL